MYWVRGQTLSHDGVGSGIHCGVEEGAVKVCQEGGKASIDPDVRSVAKAGFLMLCSGPEAGGFKDLSCVIAHVVVLVVVVPRAAAGVMSQQVKWVVTSLAESVRGVNREP